MRIILLLLLLIYSCSPTPSSYDNKNSSPERIQALLSQADTMRNKHDAALVVEGALNISKAINNDSIQLKCHQALHRAYFSSSQFNKAIEQSRLCRAILSEQNDSLKLAIIDAQIGTCHAAKGQYQKAIPLLEQSAAWFLQKGDSTSWAGITNNIAVISIRTGNTANGINKIFSILPIVRQDTSSWINTLLLLGETYFNQHNYNLSTKYYKKTLPLCLSIGDTTNAYLDILSGLAKNHKARLQYDSALVYFKEVAQIALGVGHIQREQTALGNIGWVYVTLDSIEQARKYLVKTLKSYRINPGDNNTLYGLAKNLAPIYIEDKEYEKATTLLDEAYEVAHMNNDSFNLFRIAFHLTQVHMHLGNTKKAIRYLNEYNDLDVALFKSENQKVYTEKGALHLEREAFATEIKQLRITYDASIKQSQYRQYGYISLIILVLGLGLFYYYKYKTKIRQTTKEKEIVVHKVNKLKIVAQQKEEALSRLELEKQDVLSSIAYLETQGIVIPGKEASPFVLYKDILYISSEGNNSYVHLTTQEKPLKRKKSLAKWENELLDVLFVRVHARYIVNLMYVKSWSKGDLIMQMKGISKQIPIGKTKVSALKQGEVDFQMKYSRANGDDVPHNGLYKHPPKRSR
ncbi:MAG: tetratricopeptide repeat protein [Bacteroidota bacterium]